VGLSLASFASSFDKQRRHPSLAGHGRLERLRPGHRGGGPRPTRAYVRDNDGLQPGDPAKAAQAILAALDADEPPLRLVLGADAIGNIERRLERVSGELAAWRAVGEAIAVDEQ
jgi:hypothetical protein